MEDMILVASKLPWWACLLLALVSYAVLHTMAMRPVMPATVVPGQMGDAVARGLITTLAMFGQYVMPFAFALAALLSAVTSSRQKKLYDTVAGRGDVAALNEMGWDEFEMLVGEHFRRQGFQVTRQGGNGPDGGVDLILKNGGETYLVQCKQWKAYKVGVQPVRELYGVMASRGAVGGYVVTSGKFTDEAVDFARGLNVELIDGRQLRQIIDNARRPSTDVVRHEIFPKAVSSPNCPKCGAEMKKRVARQGSNAGREFWGCSTYPKCKGIVPVTINQDTDQAKVTMQPTIPPVDASKKLCPQCGEELVLRQFQSGPRIGQQFYGCLTCKKGWPVDTLAQHAALADGGK
ncbi:restriction endonuclease [Geobacter metallireducens]|nr:restriction endonuclease [Geobacter metallireducens]